LPRPHRLSGSRSPLSAPPSLSSPTNTGERRALSAQRRTTSQRVARMPNRPRPPPLDLTDDVDVGRTGDQAHNTALSGPLVNHPFAKRVALPRWRVLACSALGSPATSGSGGN